MALVNAMELFHSIGPGVLKLALWMRKALNNAGKQYALVSHLKEKHQAIEPDVHSFSLVRRFLAQKRTAIAGSYKRRARCGPSHGKHRYGTDFTGL